MLGEIPARDKVLCDSCRYLTLLVMFRARTVFVVGAGASSEIGLPVGNQLLGKIRDLLSFSFDHSNMPSRGDRVIVMALREHLNEGSSVTRLNHHLNAAARLVQAAPHAQSIDALIDAMEQPELELVAKLAISRAILQAERDSGIMGGANGPDDRVNLSEFNDTWYSELLYILLEGSRRSAIDQIFENFSVVNFNYDRCLETNLPAAISNFYDISLSDTCKLVNGLQIHRPYGSVGRLPWQVGEAPQVGFGKSGPEEILNSAGYLRTFSEQIEEGDALNAIRATINEAERIVFLGFAFHRPNMKLLATATVEDVDLLGTAFGVSASDLSEIESDIYRAFQIAGPLGRPTPGTVMLENKKCGRFLSENRRTLTAPFDPD